MGLFFLGVGMLKNPTRSRTMLAWLRRDFPLARLSSVQCRVGDIRLPGSGKSVLASCMLRNGEFLIQIKKGQGYELIMDALIHEWAHAMTWFGSESPWCGDNPHANEHGAEWGIAYAKLYSGFEEWNFGGKGDGA